MLRLPNHQSTSQPVATRHVSSPQTAYSARVGLLSGPHSPRTGLVNADGLVSTHCSLGSALPTGLLSVTALQPLAIPELPSTLVYYHRRPRVHCFAHPPGVRLPGSCRSRGAVPSLQVLRRTGVERRGWWATESALGPEIGANDRSVPFGPIRTQADPPGN